MGPLHGVKVVDLSVMISGPWAAMMLAEGWPAKNSVAANVAAATKISAIPSRKTGRAECMIARSGVTQSFH